jgi:hypothetical protein
MFLPFDTAATRPAQGERTEESTPLGKGNCDSEMLTFSSWTFADCQGIVSA